MTHSVPPPEGVTTPPTASRSAEFAQIALIELNRQEPPAQHALYQSDDPDADYYDDEGCDCTELCAMGPTCPGGMLAGLPGSGCWRSSDNPTPPASEGGPR